MERIPHLRGGRERGQCLLTPTMCCWGFGNRLTPKPNRFSPNRSAEPSISPPECRHQRPNWDLAPRPSPFHNGLCLQQRPHHQPPHGQQSEGGPPNSPAPAPSPGAINRQLSHPIGQLTVFTVNQNAEVTSRSFRVCITSSGTSLTLLPLVTASPSLYLHKNAEDAVWPQSRFHPRRRKCDPWDSPLPGAGVHNGKESINNTFSGETHIS